MDVGGTVDRRFAPVQDVFETLLASQQGTGAAVAAWCDGTWVVDLWGGTADAAGTLPWRTDSVVQPYSVTKPFAGVCALRLIVAVRYGRAESRKSELFHRFGAYGEDDAAQAMDFIFYVLRDGARTIVVDCGFDPAKAAARGRESLVAPREALARLGVRAADVSQVLITHLHWDHVGNLDLFGATPLLVAQAELDFWSAPVARNVQFWSHVDDDGIGAVLAAQREGCVVATGDDEDVAPGIRAITVGGHSAGQQVLVVDTARGPVVLASDAAHLYEELELARPFSVAVDLQAMCEAYTFLARLRDDKRALVVPGHDPDVSTRFPALGGDADGFAFQIA